MIIEPVWNSESDSFIKATSRAPSNEDTRDILTKFKEQIELRKDLIQTQIKPPINFYGISKDDEYK